MKFNLISKCIIIAAFLTLFLTLNNLAQNQKIGETIMWSPPDKSFTVKIPFSPKEIKEEYQDEARSGYKSVRIFTAKRNDIGFLIAVLELTEDDKRQTPKEKFGGLQFFIGGDDDHEFSSTYTSRGGLVAKEILYSEKANKGVMIDGGDRIYVLGFFAKNHEELVKGYAKEFFDSFCLLKTRK